MSAHTPVLAADGFVVAADAADVPEGRGLLVQLGTHELALFRVGDSIYALDNACPHAGGSLAEGTLADGCVTCPLHGWRFDACTGEGVPPTKAETAHYPTRIDGGKVLVRIDRLVVARNLTAHAVTTKDSLTRSTSTQSTTEYRRG